MSLCCWLSYTVWMGVCMVTARNEQYQNKLTDVSEGSDFYGPYSTRLVNALVLHTELKEHKKSGTLGIKVFF
jgi:hypothetical protein